MHRIRIVVAVLVFCILPAHASDPGEPIGDCDDWVILKPGISCTDVCPHPCGDPGGPYNHPLADTSGGAIVSDNEGMFFATRRIDDACGNNSLYQVFRSDGVQEELVAFLEPRCAPFESINFVGSLLFDEEGGRLYIGQRTGPGIFDYAMIRLDGFTTSFEILQSYSPAPGTLSFRVPSMPEGFPAADRFDTYWGDLSNVGDWSGAQPLQCDFPASVPSAGDWYEIADALPALEPGQGRYYVTAVTYQGQTRYGRKSIDGTLTGRDTSVLPGCAE